MRFRILAVYGLAIASIAWAEEVQPIPAPEPEKQKLPPGFPNPLPVEKAAQPWIGVNLDKPDPTTTVHIPALPSGVGMLIRSVVQDSPAEAAGLAAPDLIWKLGDQLLVNHGQLVTLLRLYKPGDEVELSVFRAGLPMEIKLKLGEAPPQRAGFNSEWAEKTLMPDEDGPVRMIKFDSQTASFGDEYGKAVVRREGEVYKVLITRPNGEVIYDGDLPANCEIPGVPQRWLRRVCVLRRGLERALDNEMVPVRPPRPRVVPPASTTN